MTDRTSLPPTDTGNDRSRPDPAQGPAHDVAVFERLVKSERTCLFITVTGTGKIYARPMTVQDREGATVWFLAYSDSPKLGHIALHPDVNLSFVDGDDYVSTSGTARVVEDDAKKRELWNKFAQTWFQIDDPTDPRIALIRVDLTGGEYWDSPAKPVQLLDIAKMFVTGARPSDGDNAKLDLG